MAPPRTRPELMVGDIIATLCAGHHRMRPDLSFPESNSDMTWAVLGLLRKYDVVLRPLPRDMDELVAPEVDIQLGTRTRVPDSEPAEKGES